MKLLNELPIGLEVTPYGIIVPLGRTNTYPPPIEPIRALYRSV